MKTFFLTIASSLFIYCSSTTAAEAVFSAQVSPAGAIPLQHPPGSESSSSRSRAFGLSIGTLSERERSIVSYIQDHQTESVLLLERLVEINSGTQNFDGVRRVGEILLGEFDALGFETRWIDGRAFDRAGHLMAKRHGRNARRKVLLIGHLDTVFSSDSPFRHFERLPGNRVRGPGVIDMKGGDVVMLLALRSLHSVGMLDDLNVVVVLSGDEEDAGTPVESARRELIDAGMGADFALGFEDGDGDPSTAVIARRGSTGWRLEVSGNPAHSSQIFQPDVGAGAIFETSRILQGFYERLSPERDLTFSPGVILGGTDVTFDAVESRGTAFGKSNVVAGKTLTAGDLRALSPDQLKRAQATMQTVVEDHLPGTRAELLFEQGYPPMGATEGNRRLLSRLDEVSRDLGLGPVTAVDPRNAGAADVSFIAAEVPRVLDGLGLMGSGGHTVQETADLTTLPSQAAKAAILLDRLIHEAEDRAR